MSASTRIRNDSIRCSKIATSAPSFPLPDSTSITFPLPLFSNYSKAWVFSVLTDPFGSSAIWAAQRVPDDQVAAAANSFIIRQMNLSDPDNFLASPGILKLAKETGRWDGRSEFDFHQAFGANGPLEDPKGSLYVGRRVWRVMDILAPSMRLDPYWGIHPNRPSYPFSIKPDMPVTRQKIYEILRDHYEGTEFDLTQGLAAGPFANPVRWDGDNKGVKGGWERAVSMFRTSFSFVALSRSFVPDEMAVVFYGQDAPHGTVYLPFYVAQTGWPDAWARGKQTVFDTASGWWAFNFVNQWRMLRWDAIGGDVRELRETLEAEIEDSWTRTERKALRALSKGKTKGALQRLTEFAVGTAESVLEKWWQLAWRLVAKYSNGYVTVGEKPGEQSAPGYPKEWLERTEFSGWPGRTFYKPGEEPKWGVRLPEGGRPNNGSNEPKKSNIDGMSLLVGAVGLLIVQTLVGLAVLGWKRYRSASERIQI